MPDRHNLCERSLEQNELIQSLDSSETALLNRLTFRDFRAWNSESQSGIYRGAILFHL